MGKWSAPRVQAHPRSSLSSHPSSPPSATPRNHRVFNVAALVSRYGGSTKPLERGIRTNRGTHVKRKVCSKLPRRSIHQRSSGLFKESQLILGLRESGTTKERRYRKRGHSSAVSHSVRSHVPDVKKGHKKISRISGQKAEVRTRRHKWRSACAPASRSFPFVHLRAVSPWLFEGGSSRDFTTPPL